MHSAAQVVPLPGKWEVTPTFFVFDDTTQAYEPFMVQSGDHNTRAECLDAAYFEKKSFDKPQFATNQSTSPELRCVVTNEGVKVSTTVWRQICTDPKEFIEEEKYAVSLLKDAIEIENYSASKSPTSGGSKFMRQSKAIIKLKRIGDCDKAPKSKP
jgi:hypothetical protein